MSARTTLKSKPRAAKAARLKIGPWDHGELFDDDALESAAYELGYQYEVIDGRLYVWPTPNLPHDEVLSWLHQDLETYRRAHPDLIKRISARAAVYVPGRRRRTSPEPDLAVYDVFPRGVLWKMSWRDVQPFLVIEVATSNLDKDLVRNVALYAKVPSIREYWVFHVGKSIDTHFFRAYRRKRSGWEPPIQIKHGGTYSTPTLPGFRLKFDIE